MFKYRVPKAILLTVPYTGTHFAKSLFEKVGVFSTYDMPNAHWLDGNIREQWDKIIQRKLVITARDPYLTAIRSIKTGHETPIEFIAESWATCFEAMQQADHFILDIGCKKENRLNHVLELINFVGIDLGTYREDVTSYVDAWLPENESHSEHKVRYLETGELPSRYDWSLLDPAVNWYKALTINT